MSGIDEYSRVVARVGTADGRMLEISATPHHVTIADPVSTHPRWTLNSTQTDELANALLAALNR